MPLKVYNNLTRKLEEFAPLSDGKVGMYVCGITPYDETHLGHARAYITFDIIRRYLEYSGYKVKHVQNITDIDDKIINKAKLQTSNFQTISNEQKKEKCKEVVDKYSASFDEVMAKLNVKQAGEYPKATENITGMIDWIKKLMDKGYAYKLDDGVYFEVDKFKDYGKLSHRKKEDQESGARVKVDQSKRNPLDFALWKFAKADEPSWESPWGAGRPGWHIECSVMSTKYLGEQFDIHGGGLDLQFPHHENEIAQTEAATGKSPWVKYWIHNGFVTINKEKMSKSLGNIFSLNDILSNYNPMVVRLYILSTHYRSPIDFSDRELDQYKVLFSRIIDSYMKINCSINDAEDGGEGGGDLDSFKSDFVNAMDDDFNTALALSSLYALFDHIDALSLKKKLTKIILSEALNIVDEFFKILGISILKLPMPKELKDDLDRRSIARKEKKYQEADEIRMKWSSKNYNIIDTPYCSGTTISTSTISGWYNPENIK